MHDLVRAYALQAGSFGRRLDKVEIGVVEIEDATGLIVGLLSKSHHDKAGGFLGGGIWWCWDILFLLSHAINHGCLHRKSGEIGRQYFLLVVALRKCPPLRQSLSDRSYEAPLAGTPDKRIEPLDLPR